LRLKHAGTGDEVDDDSASSDRSQAASGAARTELKFEVNQLRQTVDSLVTRVSALEEILEKLRQELGG
jgi:uncharacterized protein YceH (UPF0502 family)